MGIVNDDVTLGSIWFQDAEFEIDSVHFRVQHKWQFSPRRMEVLKALKAQITKLTQSQPYIVSKTKDIKI